MGVGAEHLGACLGCRGRRSDHHEVDQTLHQVDVHPTAGRVRAGRLPPAMIDDLDGEHTAGSIQEQLMPAATSGVLYA